MQFHLQDFDDVQQTYQMIKALVRAVPDISLNKKDTIVISPDEGGMSRMYVLFISAKA